MMAAALSSGLHGDPTLSKFVTGEKGATADVAAPVCTKALIAGRPKEIGVDSGHRRIP